ncbi:hypothetical protein EF914_29930 [Streptomyces sp. WAC05458]|nr:hypothetical protein EF914_29930 [Streptomyces sp. WAC05458]
MALGDPGPAQGLREAPEGRPEERLPVRPALELPSRRHRGGSAALTRRYALPPFAARTPRHTDVGPVQVKVPCDHDGSFEPTIVKKRPSTTRRPCFTSAAQAPSEDRRALVSGCWACLVAR